MAKALHEIRDPIHTFIRVDGEERNVVDSPPIQRLRHIHQLALTYLVYPGATHKRFEHSLGVMELAGRVFDVITDRHNIHRDVLDAIPDLDGGRREWYQRVVRMAALCHDIGHLPFSHALLSEIIVGDAFGVDRMDYLMRDSHQAGVSYGRFDHFRLIDTLRVLPPPVLAEGDPSFEPQLGVEEGGLHSECHRRRLTSCSSDATSRSKPYAGCERRSRI